jgi:hypothetical protein
MVHLAGGIVEEETSYHGGHKSAIKAAYTVTETELHQILHQIQNSTYIKFLSKHMLQNFFGCWYILVD